MRLRDGYGRVLVELAEDVNGVIVEVKAETIVGFLKKNLIAEFVFPAVGVLNEFLDVREVVISVKSGEVGGGLKKEVDKETVGFFDISGVKMGVDFKGTVIAEINIKAVELHAKAFGWIDEVIFFSGSVTRDGSGIICASVVSFRRFWQRSRS